MSIVIGISSAMDIIREMILIQHFFIIFFNTNSSYCTSVTHIGAQHALQLKSCIFINDIDRWNQEQAEEGQVEDVDEDHHRPRARLHRPAHARRLRHRLPGPVRAQARAAVQGRAAQRHREGQGRRRESQGEGPEGPPRLGPRRRVRHGSLRRDLLQILLNTSNSARHQLRLSPDLNSL